MNKVLHVIDSLARGGAETLLVGAVDGLIGFEHIIVTLENINEFPELSEKHKIYCLDHKSKLDFFKSVIKLKRIIKDEKVEIIHSHLFWSTIIARIAVTKQEKLITTYHSLLYDPNNKEQFSKKMLWLEKLTYRSKFKTVAISNAVKQMLLNAGLRRDIKIIYNYVDDKFFLNQNRTINLNKIKAVSVGNLRVQKNHKYLVETVLKIDNLNMSLDIYGEGSEKEHLKKMIGKNRNISLKGKSLSLENDFQNYNLFLLASKFEGFGIALVEAMAAGLPCIVSDIKTFREIGKDSCIYFNLDNENNLVDILNSISSGDIQIQSLLYKSKKRAEEFSKENYIKSLTNLYNV